MLLKPLSKEDIEKVREWRHENMFSLRTPFFLTKEMQQDYYEKVICNRESKTRYWGVHDSLIETTEKSCPLIFIGYGGIENIHWENGNGEISLLIGPDWVGKGLGSRAVSMFLDQAFNYFNLQTVYGECYLCNPAWVFWDKLTKKYNGKSTTLPRRKYYKGKYWDSFYFTIFKEGFFSE